MCGVLWNLGKEKRESVWYEYEGFVRHFAVSKGKAVCSGGRIAACFDDDGLATDLCAL